MNEQRRNLAVGITVLVGLVLLGAMILRFAGVPELFQRGYVLQLHADGTHEVHEGDPIHLSGMPIGRVTAIEFTDGDPRKGVTFTTRIDQNVNIPANAACFIYGGSGLKSSYVDLASTGECPIDPATGRKMEFLPKDRVTVLEARPKGSGLIPDELMESMKSFSRLADSVNAMLTAPVPATGAAGTQTATGTAPAIEVQGLASTLAKLNRALDALNAVMGDNQNQANIKLALDNLAKASAGAVEAMNSLKAFAADAGKATQTVQAVATRTGDDVHELSVKLIADAERISQLMTTLNKAAQKIESGEGAMGKLLNDPELYNNLTEMSKGLSTLVNDFDSLVKQWKERGVELKMK
jgi:phospholipid/cholesterol/gamma-HCH transport system substrate-binding protein